MDSITVLCVDDDPDLVSLTGMFLEQENDRIETITITDPRNATEQLSSNHIDCIVSDYDMPHLDGLELLQSVRAEYPDLPFILFTGKGSEEVASDAIANGVTDYLQKETGNEQYELLVNRVLNAVDQLQSARQAEKLDRIRTILRDVNQVLVRSRESVEIEKQVCEIVADSDPYLVVSLYDIDENGSHLRRRRSAGYEIEKLATIELGSQNPPPFQNVLSEALRTDNIVTSNEVFNSDDQNAQFSGENPDMGSLAAIPLSYRDHHYGLLTLVAREEWVFDEQEMELLEEVAGDVSHAIYRTDLYERMNRYSRIIDNLPIGVYRNTPLPDGTIVEANPAVIDLFDADSRSDLIGVKFTDLYPRPEDREIFTNQLEEHGEVQNLELELQTLDGEPFWASVTGMKTREGSEEYFDAVIQDISEKRNREEQLLRYERLYQLAPIGIFRSTSDGNLLEANQRMAEMVGFDSPEQAVETANNLGEQLYVDSDRRETFIERLEAQGSVENFVYTAKTRSGEHVDISMNASIFSESAERPFEIVGYNTFANDASPEE